MFEYKLAVQSEASQKAVRQLLGTAAGAASFARLRAAYAYATAGGAQLAAWTIATVSGDWEAMDKRWLISIDWGHTDPVALEFLASLPRSAVRVPYADEVLRRNLVPAVCFHPKTAIFDCGRIDKPPTSLVVGSANLTVSGLETGHEHAAAAIWLSGRLSRDAATQLSLMQQQAKHMEQVWRNATPVTAAVIDQYRRKWRRRQVSSEDGSAAAQSVIGDARGARRRFELPLTTSAEVARANALWIEVQYVVENLGRGMPGNQIDMQRGSRVFFGFSAQAVPRNTQFGDVRIDHRGHVSTHHMRFANNYMDRLNLPIPGAGGPPTYRDSMLLFTRRPNGAFNLEVGSASQIRAWKTRSRRQGTLFAMRGGRQWGVFV